MKFKISRILNERQMRKVRYGFWCGIAFICYELASYMLLTEVNAADPISWNGKDDYLSAEEVMYDRGRIVYYSTNTVACTR